MKILLIGNYSPDAQVSMNKFANMLEKGFSLAGHEVKVLCPEKRLCRSERVSNAADKWLGYFDKFLIFPWRIRKEIRWADIVHIGDHSNSMYVRWLRNKAHAVTCHDVLAIRGGFGENTDCPASLTGMILQRWILNGLKTAQMVVCDSTSTRNDLLRLLRVKDAEHIITVMLGLNFSYNRIGRELSEKRAEGVSGLQKDEEFVLHVGSDARRKNREGVLRVFSMIKDRWKGKLVLAGAPLSEEMTAIAADLNIEDRIVSLVRPEDRLLEALYNRAFVLLYPSRFEGYGWPIIEAQACGCPVVCSSDCGPFPEIVRDSAIMRQSDDVKGFAEAVLSLTDQNESGKWIERGLENVKRFDPERMISRYLEIYENLLKGKP